MKSKKSIFMTFFITFFIAYALLGYSTAMIVGVKYPGGITLWERFLTRTEFALKDGWPIKIILSFASGIIANILTYQKTES